MKKKKDDTMKIKHGYNVTVEVNVTEDYQKMGDKKFKEMRKAYGDNLEKNLKALLSLGFEKADVEVEVHDYHVEKEGIDNLN